MSDNNSQQAQPEFSIQRIYIKDISFEAPQTPAIFQSDWKPELNMQLNINTNNLGEDLHEVILKVTVTANTQEKPAFLAEIQQAGIFLLKGFPNDQLQPVLGIVCPNILFPYARELVSDLVSRGTFPPLYLQPVNFEALYAQHQQQGSQKQAESPIILQ